MEFARAASSWCITPLHMNAVHGVSKLRQHSKGIGWRDVLLLSLLALLDLCSLVDFMLIGSLCSTVSFLVLRCFCVLRLVVSSGSFGFFFAFFLALFGFCRLLLVLWFPVFLVVLGSSGFIEFISGKTQTSSFKDS